MDIENIKDKRQEVACKLRKLAKQEWMSIDIDDIHQMIFGTRLHPTKDTTVAEYDEYDREICSALADLIDTTCDFCQRVMPYGMTKTIMSIMILPWKIQTIMKMPIAQSAVAS